MTGAPLLVELWRLLAAHRPAVRQTRCFDRLRALVVGTLLAVTRPTITGMLQALGLVNADWSACYRLVSRQRLDYAVLTRCYLRDTLAQLPADAPYVAVLDGTQLPADAPYVAVLDGTQLPRWRGYSRALPLRFDPAFPPKAVPDAADPRTEWAAGLAQRRWLRDELDAAGRREQRVLALGDGSYEVVDLWRDLPARTVLLARTARNRTLYELPPPGAHRNRRYGPRARPPAAWLAERSGWQHTTLRVRGRALALRYRVEGPFVRETAPGRPLFLLVVKGSTATQRRRYRRRRAPRFYLVNAVQRADGTWALPRPAEELLAWAWHRWEVEVTHRALKTDWGVGAVQCWSVPATVRAVQVQVWSYALALLAGYRAWGYDRHPAAVRPPGLWWPGGARWSVAMLQRGYRQVLAPLAAPDFLPGCPGIRGTWAANEAWLRHLDALLAADAAP